MGFTKTKKIIGIVFNVIVYIFIFVVLISLVFSLTQKNKNDDAISLFGHQMRIVVSPSMEECELTDVSDYDIKNLKVKTMIFIEEIPTDSEERADWYEDLREGDVLTFKYVYIRQEVITHRLIDKVENGKGGYILYLQGDNKNSADGATTQIIDTSDEASANYVIGKVVGQSYPLGWLVSLIKSSLGLIFVVIIPSIVIITIEVIKIINLLSYKKKAAENEKKKLMQEEIDELKKKIEILEKNKNEEV